MFVKLCVHALSSHGCEELQWEVAANLMLLAVQRRPRGLCEAQRASQVGSSVQRARRLHAVRCSRQRRPHGNTNKYVVREIGV